MSVIIVTGSSGLIGSETVRFFSEKGFEVVGIDNDMRAEFFGTEASTSWNRALLEKDIKRKPILGIISDTSFYLGTDISIFEPVLREVSAFSPLFSQIYWFGYGHNIKCPDN